MRSTQRNALIIGAGPAGLTAAFELLERTDVRPLIIERDTVVGGLSRTVRFKRNRIDIGGHRFFSKSDEIMRWWSAMLPVMEEYEGQGSEAFRQGGGIAFVSSEAHAADPDRGVMLVRHRLSRILHRKRLFEYPLSLSFRTVRDLGYLRTCSIMFSYLAARLFPRRPERTLEDFFINKFGDRLYRTFFQEYTEKVWGAPCKEIRAEWGAQRIKGLSIYRVLVHAARSLVPIQPGIAQKETETSLIDRFLYPQYGPGQMWETVAGIVGNRGGEIRFHHTLHRLEISDGRVVAAEVRDVGTGMVERLRPDFVFSSMPVRDLIRAMGDQTPRNVHDVAERLQYRDFMTVGLLCRRFSLPGDRGRAPKDTWIYIQEPGVKVGRIQIFNNWSPWMVEDPEHTFWIGLEYFASKGDELWSMADEDFVGFAKEELARLGMARIEDILDGTVIRMEKAYPSYIGEGYERLGEVKDFLLSIENLYPIGRNGTHRYNNQDHSMMMAIQSVRHVAEGAPSKEDIWSINLEQEYHEEKK